MKAAINIITICSTLIIFSEIINAQVIPSGRKVDWSVAGLQQPVPNYPTIVNILNFGGNGNGSVINDAALQAAKNSLGNDSGIIYFPSGTYLFHSQISLRSGLVLKGQGSALSTLQFNLSGASDLIDMSGTFTNTIDKIASPAIKNNFSIVVSNGSLFNAGDYVKLYQTDTALVLDVFNSVGQIFQIKNVSGNTITFFSQLRRNYNLADSPRLQKLLMVRGAGVECLKIKRMDSTATQQSNININYAARCWIRGVESDSCNFAHVSISSSTNIEIAGSFFHGSFGYGAGGQGYGIATNRTTGECLIENNIFRHLRHSMLVQSGSNGNVFAYNYSRETYKSENTPNDLAGDIVLHGNYPYANLFEGNIVQNLVFDASHRINGPNNTFFRNRAELYGILFSSTSGDSSNIVGNEITGVGVNQGNYAINGTGNFEYANNIKGNIFPFGTTSLPDSSYYYNRKPYFFNPAATWPSIGIPNIISTGTIPAKTRFLSGTNFTDCTPNNVFASHLFLFTAERRSMQNVLNWQVNDINETRHFEVEKSTNGSSFFQLKILDATEGIIKYSFNDAVLNSNINYYRIVQVLKTGAKVYSKIIGINNRDKNLVNVFPNPVRDMLNVIINEKIKSCEITIKNYAGVVFNRYFSNSTAGNVIALPTGILPAGMYIIEVKDVERSDITVQKFVKIE